MRQQTVLTGIVLQATLVGDFDKRLVVLTKERGRITIFARGARRPNSPVMAACVPFSYGAFTLYEGRDAYTLVSVDVKNYFIQVKNDLEAISYGTYFCEFASYLTRENNDERDIMKLLYQTLRALANNKIPNELIRYIYEIKVLAYYGLAMQVFSCVKCESKDNLDIFCSKAGGLLCHNCKCEGRTIRVCESTIYTLQYIISSSVEKLYTFLVSSTVIIELRWIVKDYIATYVDKEFKSLKFLETITK